MSDEKIMPKIGDTVIQISVNWQGYASYGNIRTVAKIHKNGNVVLTGSNNQHGVYVSKDFYRLSECSGNKAYSLLTNAVKADIQKSKQLDLFFNSKHKLDDLFKNNRRRIRTLEVGEITLMNKAIEKLVKTIEKAIT